MARKQVYKHVSPATEASTMYLSWRRTCSSQKQNQNQKQNETKINSQQKQTAKSKKKAMSFEIFVPWAIHS